MAETAASDVEAQGVKPTADSVDAQQSVGVGVLGWLGFIIVNLAAWGIVGVTTAISWIFGLGVCLLYIALLIGLAFWLERSGSVYKQFINLLWVLAGWFVFIAGAYIAVNTLGRDGISTGPYPTGISTSAWQFDQGLQDLLPSNATPSLRTWGPERWALRRNGLHHIWRQRVLQWQSEWRKSISAGHWWSDSASEQPWIGLDDISVKALFCR